MNHGWEKPKLSVRKDRKLIAITESPQKTECGLSAPSTVWDSSEHMSADVIRQFPPKHHKSNTSSNDMTKGSFASGSQKNTYDRSPFGDSCWQSLVLLEEQTSTVEGEHRICFFVFSHLFCLFWDLNVDSSSLSSLNLSTAMSKSDVPLLLLSDCLS